MKKTKTFPYLLVIILFLSSCKGTLHVSGHTELTVNQAVQKFEEKVQHKVLLPKGTFPYKLSSDYVFIHQEESRLDLSFINENKPSEILKIYIQPATKELIHEQGDQDYTLKDGTQVIYRPYFPSTYAIEFQKNGLNYIVGLSKHDGNKNFHPNELLSIANGLK